MKNIKYHYIKSLRTLYDDNGNEVIPFNLFVKNLENRHYKKNTIDSYCTHIPQWLNYMHLAYELAPPENSLELADLIIGYTDFLLYGKEADGIPGKIAILLDKNRKTNPSSLKVINAAITYFIDFGETHHELLAGTRIGKLYPTVTKALSVFEKKNIQQNSVIGGNVKFNNTTKRKIPLISDGEDHLNCNPPKYIPIEKVVEIVSSAKTYRDKALYYNLIATGDRTSEALQTTLNDIDMENMVVYIRNPRECNDNRMKHLTQDEIDKLSFKGRKTDTTFMIEPFKSLFFENLRLYISNERDNDSKYPFLFQNMKSGKPLFLSDRSSRSKTFKKRLELVGLFGKSLHSLRHTYGDYVLNLLPRADGSYGTDILQTNAFMGHKSIKSTEIYGTKDTEASNSIIDIANKIISQTGLNIETILQLCGRK